MQGGLRGGTRLAQGSKVFKKCVLLPTVSCYKIIDFAVYNNHSPCGVCASGRRAMDTATMFYHYREM